MDLREYRLINEMLKIYEKKGFNKAQIKEIRRGIEADIDISKYNDINISASEMFETRWHLTLEKIKEEKNG